MSFEQRYTTVIICIIFTYTKSCWCFFGYQRYLAWLVGCLLPKLVNHYEVKNQGTLFKVVKLEAPRSPCRSPDIFILQLMHEIMIPLYFCFSFKDTESKTAFSPWVLFSAMSAMLVGRQGHPTDFKTRYPNNVYYQVWLNSSK